MKFLLIIGALLVGAAVLPAQTYLGLSGGGGLDGMVSLRATLPLEKSISKTISWQSGIAFTQHHNPRLLDLLSNDRNYESVTVWYAGVPMLAKVRFFPSITTVYGLIGAQINYGLYLSATYETFNYQRFSFQETSINRLDMSFNAGLGIEKEISRQCKIFAEMMLLASFYDIDRNAMSEIFNEGRVFNLGILAPLKPRSKTSTRK